MKTISQSVIDELSRQFEIFREMIDNPIEVFIGLVDPETKKLVKVIDYETLE